MSYTMVLSGFFKCYRVQADDGREASLEGQNYSPIRLSSQQYNRLDNFIFKMCDFLQTEWIGFPELVWRREHPLGCLSYFHNGLSTDEPSVHRSVRDTVKTAIKSLFFLSVSLNCRLKFCNHLGLTIEQGRSVSACFSLDLFKIVKKIITNVKMRAERREMMRYLALILPILKAVVDHCHVFIPVKNADMEQHLNLYIKHYRAILERELSAVGHSRMRHWKKHRLDIVFRVWWLKELPEFPEILFLYRKYFSLQSS